MYSGCNSSHESAKHVCNPAESEDWWYFFAVLRSSTAIGLKVISCFGFSFLKHNDGARCLFLVFFARANAILRRGGRGGVDVDACVELSTAALTADSMMVDGFVHLIKNGQNRDTSNTNPRSLKRRRVHRENEGYTIFYMD